MAVLSREDKRIKRHRRTRKKIHGSAVKPRLAVFRSNKHIHVQLIDDDAKKTICASSSNSPSLKKSIKGTDQSGAEIVGKSVAEQALAKGIKEIVFDCGGFAYHGRIKALADAARKAGLVF